MRLMSMLPVKPGLSLGCLALLLAGCTTAMPPDQTPALGAPFNEYVKQGYVRLASAAYGEGDVPAGWHFRRKARSAMIGDTVWPDKVASYEVPEQLRPEALALRERLIAALEADGRTAAPEQAAAAQANFDCWLEELSENPQSSAATACRDAFVAALEETENALVPRGPFVVFFERGGAELDDEARALIARVAETIETLDPTRIEVRGYSDIYGATSGNLQISQRRAETVANALIEAGVPAALIDVQPGGEAAISPISAENRRAEIVVMR